MTALQIELEKIQAEDRQAQADAGAAAWRSYREILHRRHDPRPGDARRLIDVMKAAGITFEQHQQHVEQIGQFEAAQRKILTDEYRAQLRADIEAARAEAQPIVAAAAASVFKNLSARDGAAVFHEALRGMPQDAAETFREATRIIDDAFGRVKEAEAAWSRAEDHDRAAYFQIRSLLVQNPLFADERREEMPAANEAAAQAD
jgi:Cdc6-like AAA superfamily ATPase